MAKIAFIKPYQKLTYTSMGAPMGVMYLSSVLKIKGHDTCLLDLRLHPKKPRLVIDWLREVQPDLVGISAFSSEADAAHEISGMIKEAFPDMTIVVGGPYPSTAPERVMADPNVDYCIRGEAETSFPLLVDHIVEGQGLPREVPGAVFRDNGEVVQNPPGDLIDDLDTIPMPDWELIDHEAYFYKPRNGLFYMHKAYMPIFTSRGCPYQCIYCHHIFGKKFRPHSVERTLEEIGILYNHYGIRELQIFDDIFNLDKERASEICKGIIESGNSIALNFPNGLRADKMDHDLIKIFKQAGTFKITYAVETASPRLQKLIKKNMDLEKAKEIMELTDREGVFQSGYFMVGFPTETEEEVWQTIHYARDSRLHAANFFVVNAFEGTGLADLARSVGVDINFEDARHDYWKPYIKLSEVAPERLARIVKKANRQLYLHPWRLPRMLRMLPNKKQLPLFAWIYLRLSLAG